MYARACAAVEWRVHQCVDARTKAPPPDVRAARGAGGAAVGVLHVSLWRSCAAQGGPCAAVCGHGEGVSRRRKTRATRVPLRPWKPPRPRREREGNPVCVRHPRVCACDRRAAGGGAPWSPGDASQRNRKFCGRGALPADENVLIYKHPPSIGRGFESEIDVERGSLDRPAAGANMPCLLERRRLGQKKESLKEPGHRGWMFCRSDVITARPPYRAVWWSSGYDV